MQGFDWDDVRHFLAVARSGSLTAAAESLAVNQSTVSRRIAQFERRLGTPLFDRSRGSGWVLSLAGEQMLASAEQMHDTAQQISREVLKNSTELTGRIRVTCGDAGASAMMIQTITDFAKQYPQIELEVIVSNETLDLATREADVALRATFEPPPNVVGKRICTIGMGLYASRRFLDTVEGAESDWPVVLTNSLGENLPGWVTEQFPTRRATHLINTLAAKIEALQAGLGVGCIPLVLGDRLADLARLSTVELEAPIGFWVLSHVDLRSTARVRVFRDYLVEKFTAKADAIRYGSVNVAPLGNAAI